MKTIWKIIKGLATIFLLIVLILIIIQKFTHNKIAIGHIYVFHVASGSMAPGYEIGDIIITMKIPAKELKIGDAVTYLGKESNLKGLTITHQIVKKREENGKFYFVTKGIANEVEDPEISEDDIYGKVVYKTIIFSLVGRLMNNTLAYYLIFVIVGVGFAYELASFFFFNKKEEIQEEFGGGDDDEDDDDEDDEEQEENEEEKVEESTETVDKDKETETKAEESTETVDKDKETETKAEEASSEPKTEEEVKTPEDKKEEKTEDKNEEG